MEPATTTHERSRELADLRRRAYGPDADIQRDPEALRRLNELEDLARPSPAAAAPEGEPAADAASVITADPAEQLSAIADGATDSVVRPQWGRAAWVVATVVLVLALVGTTAALTLSESANSAGGPDVTLGVAQGGMDLGPDSMESIYNWGVEPGSIVKYEPYDSIGVWAGHTSTDGRCVLLSFHDRIFTAACAHNGLDPVLDLYADDHVQVSLEEPLLPGGVIRFIARPTGVDVWVRQGQLSLPGLGD